MTDIIQHENKYYISVNSTYADDRVKVLNHTNTFGIFDRWGDVKQLGEGVQGIYHNGTRYISDLELRVNNKRPLLLSSSVKEKNEILSVDLTNPSLVCPNGKRLEKGTLYIGRSKFVRNGACYEQIRLSNYGSEPYEFEVSVGFNADFRDIFEVRGMERGRRGEVYEIKHLPDSKLRISYRGLDGQKRVTQVCFSQKPNGWDNHNKAIFHVKLAAHERCHFDYAIYFLENDEQKPHIGYVAGRKLLEEELAKGNEIIAQVVTTNEQFSQWIERSKYDLLSLLADTEHGKYPYAGVPWYNTAFGRDGIITALQTLWAAPHIARDVLTFLAHTQATEENAQQDAEPGKIIHEVRGGEMVELNEIPFKRYYGSVDATPLFVMLAGAYFKRTADLDTIQRIWKNIEAAIYWIDTYGDTDGDGFVEYKHKSKNGLTNQGWKDSYDSVFDEYGNLAESPIALCEVQAYVYDAKLQAGYLARRLGYRDQAEKWELQAQQLREHFNKTFWDDEIQGFVIALDGKKKPCKVASSNMGHCLFTGIAHEDKACKIVERLMQPDMFSGWGIRTLSSNAPRYNPMSYHNGSVWPHDVSLIAKGFARYGYKKETLLLTNALFKASLFIELQRLPELFCGFERRGGEGPTNYPVACSPQAWAVGAVYMLLGACLNIHIDAEEKKVYFHRTDFPEGIERICIDRLQLGNDFANLEIHCDASSTGVMVKACPAGWQILTITDT